MHFPCLCMQDPIPKSCLMFSSAHSHAMFVKKGSSNSYDLTFQTEFATVYQSLTLIGMRGDNFISLSFFHQILSAEFLSKISKLKR